MGNSRKKSALKVDAAVPSAGSAKEGKREAEDELDEQVTAKKQKRDDVAKKQKNGKESRSDVASSYSGHDEEYARNSTLSSQEKKGNPATSCDSSEYSDDDSDEDSASKHVLYKAPKSKQASLGGKNGPDATKKKDQSSQSSPNCCSESISYRSCDEENGVMDVDEGASSEDSVEEARKKKTKVLLNAASSARNPDSKIVEKDISSDDIDDDDNDNDNSDNSEKLHTVNKSVVDSENSEDNEEETEEKSSKTPQENPKMPATLKEQNVASKTICVRNLSYSVERADLEILFKECGEIVDVRLHVDKEGRFRGFGHVQFATAEAAKKALKLDNTELLRCPIKVIIAREKREYTPSSSNWSNSFQDGGRVQSQTVFVKGFDKSLTEEKIKASLEELFSSCGEITRISIPKYLDSGAVKGFAHLDFKNVDSLKKALQLHETELGGFPLLVEKALPRRDGGHQFGGSYGSVQGRWDRGRSGGGWRH